MFVGSAQKVWFKSKEVTLDLMAISGLIVLFLTIYNHQIFIVA
jgi:hypothetical protein